DSCTGSRHGINAPLVDPGLQVIGTESNELADLAERDAALIDQPSDESGRYTKPRGDLAGVEQRCGMVVAVGQLSFHTVVKAAAGDQRDRTVRRLVIV